VQQPRGLGFAGGRNHNFSASGVNGKKITLVRHPHAGEASKVIHLLDIA
jgi:hypothetical protein